MSADVELIFADGPGARVDSRGGIRRRIALRIDGEDQDVVTIRLDSDPARQRQAKRWVEAFDLDPADLAEKLRRAAVLAVAESQQRRDQPVVRGTESPPSTPHTLDEVRPVFAKWLPDIDPLLLDVVFGVIMAHRLEGDPVWLFIVGAPGDGKTECLRTLSDDPFIHTLSTLTPGALISGFITDGPDPSLLPKLDGKVLVIKDFTTVLEMANEARSEVLGTLRDAYDGEACKAFGTGEEKRYQSRFGLLAAVTPVIDSYWGVSTQLGERFLKFRLEPGKRESKVRRAMSNTNNETAMRDQLAEAALSVLAQAPDPPTLSEAIEDRLIALADFVALARSSVNRDRTGVVRFIPSPEVGTRVGKALKKLCMGIAMARGLDAVTDDEYEIVARVGLDAIPSMRHRMVDVLWRSRHGFQKTAHLADDAEIPTDTAKVWLDDLRLLGMVDRHGEPNVGYSWLLGESVVGMIGRAGLFDSRVRKGVGGDFAPPTPSGTGDVRGTESPPTPHKQLNGHDGESAVERAERYRAEHLAEHGCLPGTTPA